MTKKENEKMSGNDLGCISESEENKTSQTDQNQEEK